MKKLSQLMTEITAISSDMEANYPELYKNISETPMSFGKCSGNEICTEDLKNYLNTLKEQLTGYIKTHKIKASDIKV
jgi:hypothetical protein